jgi:hypothetical protein
MDMGTLYRYMSRSLIAMLSLSCLLCISCSSKLQLLYEIGPQFVATVQASR